MRVKLDLGVQDRQLRVRRQRRPLAHAGLDDRCVFHLTDHFERSGAQEAILAGERSEHQVRAPSRGARHDVPAPGGDVDAGRTRKRFRG